MNKPKVSIIHSYYNGIQYLEEFLTNIHEQSMIKDIELMFVGCCLSEQEKNILQKFSNKINIKQILVDDLKTQTECWNLGILNSSAKYCCIHNVDDVRTFNSIEKQYKFLESNKDVDCTHSMFIISNKYNNRFGKLIDHSVYNDEEYLCSFLLGPFFMFKKNIVDNIGYFDEDLKTNGDYDFAMRIARKCKIKMLENFIDGYFLDEQKGLSTRGDNLQPIERTVVEMRYELNHKIDTRFIPYTEGYKIKQIKQFGIYKEISLFI